MCKAHAHVRLAFFAVLLVACKTGSPNTAVGAAVTTAAALGASAANRAAGGCYAICTQLELDAEIASEMEHRVERPHPAHARGRVPRREFHGRRLRPEGGALGHCALQGLMAERNAE